MRTYFTPEQLADAETEEMRDIIRHCVHCGLCLTSCPSYNLLGDELDSPRGRIRLIQEVLEKEEVSLAMIKHLDRCLGCNACVSACPAGVDYMHLSELARVRVEESGRRRWWSRLWRYGFYLLSRHEWLLRLVLLLGLVGKLFLWLLPRSWRAGFVFTPADFRMLVKAKVTNCVIHPAIGPMRLRTVLYKGCVQRVLAPEIDAATIRLLTRHQAECSVIDGADCCGAVALTLGKREAARRIARGNIVERPHDADYIVSNAAGCGLAMKDYVHLLPGEGEAGSFSGDTRDVSEMIYHLGFKPLDNPPGAGMVVAWHGACSLRHGQRIDELPRHLLEQAGYHVVLPEGSHLCCGWAGSYHLFQGDLSREIRDRRAEAFNGCGADIVVSGSMGCLLHLAPKLGVPVAHFVQLLDWASGGPPPKYFT